jgi:hypothetical protein
MYLFSIINKRKISMIDDCCLFLLFSDLLKACFCRKITVDQVLIFRCVICVSGNHQQNIKRTFLFNTLSSYH